jgi:hypothetical protein
VLAVLVPLLEALVLPVAWPLSLVVVPVLMQLVVQMVVQLMALMHFWVALVMPRTRSVDTTRVPVVPVPVLEAQMLRAAWLLSLVVVPVPVPAPMPMQQMVLVVLPVAWLLSWRALANETRTRTTTPPTTMPML